MSKSSIEEKDNEDESQEHTPTVVDAQSSAGGDHIVAVPTESDVPPDGGYGWFDFHIARLSDLQADETLGSCALLWDG